MWALSATVSTSAFWKWTLLSQMERLCSLLRPQETLCQGCCSLPHTQGHQHLQSHSLSQQLVNQRSSFVQPHVLCFLFWGFYICQISTGLWHVNNNMNANSTNTKTNYCPHRHCIHHFRHKYSAIVCIVCLSLIIIFYWHAFILINVCCFLHSSLTDRPIGYIFSLWLRVQ